LSQGGGGRRWAGGRLGAAWAAAFALTLGALLLATPGRGAPPRILRATVERVADGDTLTALTDNATRLRIRLAGIDAPELSRGAAPGQPYGAEAHRLLERLVGNRSVRVESFGPDAYRRLLAVLWAGEMNINLVMVRTGLAEIYRGARCQAYCLELEEAGRAARQDRLGMWAQDRYESPAAYRKRQRLDS